MVDCKGQVSSHLKSLKGQISLPSNDGHKVWYLLKCLFQKKKINIQIVNRSNIFYVEVIGLQHWPTVWPQVK